MLFMRIGYRRSLRIEVGGEGDEDVGWLEG